jgi:hypothetical protein
MNLNKMARIGYGYTYLRDIDLSGNSVSGMVLSATFNNISVMSSR